MRRGTRVFTGFLVAWILCVGSLGIFPQRAEAFPAKQAAKLIWWGMDLALDFACWWRQEDLPELPAGGTTQWRIQHQIYPTLHTEFMTEGAASLAGFETKWHGQPRAVIPESKLQASGETLWPVHSTVTNFLSDPCSNHDFKEAVTTLIESTFVERPALEDICGELKMLAQGQQP